ncbi:TMEM43 family protein [Candidatus Saccharibacteria bacterium]|nr:TMEM43 family protein [Candidatus Saccharibacteria bacterium]
MLERKVEMYQWEEDEDTKTRETVGGSEETTTTYTYTKGWSTKAIDSGKFNTPSGHENPSELPYEQSKIFDEEARLGDFKLRGSTIELIGGATTVPVAEFDTSKLPNSHISGAHIYIGAQPASPMVGDVRISFSAIPAGLVSVIAQQDGGKLVPYKSKSGSIIELASRGEKTSDELITAAANKNTQLTWLYRAAGFLAMWIGLTMILGPFSMLFAFIPFLKSVTGFLIGVATLLITVILSSLTIAVMWLFYRPLIAIGIIVGAIGVTWLIKAFILDKKKGTPAPLPAQPLAPPVTPTQPMPQPPSPPVPPAQDQTQPPSTS